jgi:hypothetical protein
MQMKILRLAKNYFFGRHVQTKRSPYFSNFVYSKPSTCLDNERLSKLRKVEYLHGFAVTSELHLT